MVARHFAAKLTGAEVLSRLLSELPDEEQPDFCVLFSSTSAVLAFPCAASSSPSHIHPTTFPTSTSFPSISLSSRTI